jgi:hypothetical protein
MSVFDKVRLELIQANSLAKGLCSYIAKERQYQRLYELSITIASIVGSFCFIYEKYITLVLTIIIAILSLIKFFYIPEKELARLDRIMDQYNTYYINLVSLYSKRYYANTNELEVEEMFKNLQIDIVDKKSEINKLSCINYNKLINDNREVAKIELNKLFPNEGILTL